MRALVIREFGGPDSLERAAVPRPRPGRGEILVRVVAAGVHEQDAALARGELDGARAAGRPLIPGREVAGVVEELGPDPAGRFRKGDRVWGLLSRFGGYAEFAVLPESAAALMPAKLLFEEAASLVAPALGAHQVLEQRGVTALSDVWVLEPACDVGLAALQLARSRVARVTARVEGAHVALLSNLGAASVVSTDAAPPPEAIVIDASDAPFPEPVGEQLGLLARLVDSKQLKAHVDRIVPFGDGIIALKRLEERDRTGRVVLAL